MSEITGDTKGLKASQVKALERVYRRRVAASQVVSPELAGFLSNLSHELGRQVGVLINRRGGIEHVILGDATRIFLPDVGRMRGAQGRFRGLRLVHTHLGGEPLSKDDLTDLTLLRFDLVAAIGVSSEGHADQIFIGHLLPDNPGGKLWRELPAEPVHAQATDFQELMTALEAEFSRGAPKLASTEQGQNKALLVHVAIGRTPDTDARLAELKELCRTAGVQVLDIFIQRRTEPDPRTLVGSGKLEEILLRAMQLGAETILFDQNLTPTQARTISDFTELKIIDRTMLILDIFAQHARSRDGKLQVELAQLRYALPRLVEKNTMMSRLTGGIGGRGPGETRLEINRRRARERILLLEKKREEFARSRRLKRQKRNDSGVPVVAIVGYTNAGKSTLLNALTHGDAAVADKLFATLDPISRRLRFPHEREVVLTDTVGFIRDLPDDLVAAFRSTLEELADADLLLHVFDGSDEDFEQHVAQVDRLLGELALGEKPRILLLNKRDKLDAETLEIRLRATGAIAISAEDPGSFAPVLLAVERGLFQTKGHPALAAPGGTYA